MAYLSRGEFVTGRLERKGEWIVVGKDVEISTVQEMPKVFDSLVDCEKLAAKRAIPTLCWCEFP